MHLVCSRCSRHAGKTIEARGQSLFRKIPSLLKSCPTDMCAKCSLPLWFPDVAPAACSLGQSSGLHRDSQGVSWLQAAPYSEDPHGTGNLEGHSHHLHYPLWLSRPYLKLQRPAWPWDSTMSADTACLLLCMHLACVLALSGGGARKGPFRLTHQKAHGGLTLKG